MIFGADLWSVCHGYNDNL